MSTTLKGTSDELRQRFLALKSAQDLAGLLDVPLKQLIYHARVAPPATKYTEFSIAKKNGTDRKISAPVSAVKILQKKLNQVLLSVYERPAGVHGFAKGKNILTNAQVHLGAKFVLTVDLKDFFPSVNFGRVRGLFMARPYSLVADVATLLAQLSCNGSLPQGSPSSPVISNMICARLDSRLLRLAQRLRCKYSRYADDITFSTTRGAFPKELAHLVKGLTGDALEIGDDLRDIIHFEGFDPNADKMRLRTRVGRQEVTGLTINQFPNVRRNYANQLRAMLHAWEKYGYDLAESEFRHRYDTKHRNASLPPPSFRRVVKGKLDFLGMIRGKDDPVYVGLARHFHKLEGNSQFTAHVGPHSRLDVIQDAMWILETNFKNAEGELITVQGTAFALAGVGIVTCSHTAYSETVAFQPHALKHLPITIIAQEPTIDLAIISIPGSCPVQLVKGDPVASRPIDPVSVWGFPNYNLGDAGLRHSGVITGYRTRSGIRRILCDASIIAGNSGGPVLDSNNLVIGVAVTGADSHASAADTENHGIIPITALDSLR